MRCLLVQAASPRTYWSYDHSLPFVGKGAVLPPLGLATLAAHLPPSWELRVRDAHLGPVADDELRWADAVLVSGMLVQSASMREVLARARRLARPSVAGGPAPTTSPRSFADATYLFLGEAEGRLDRLVEALEHPGRAKDRVLSPAGGERPDLALARVPRFDLLALDRYASASIQVSRGCPFSCEFCDVIEVFGRRPRVKRAAQVLAELDALRALGARGSLFLVDDNFIGNRRAAADLLPRIAAWQRAHGAPFDLYTEASIDLAGEPALLAAMADAGFSAVFVGVETPNRAALAGAGKRQNLRADPAEAIATITAAGLEVYAGLIVGFDADDETIFDRQLAFVSGLPVPRAMIGVLSALPGTALAARLEREGRLRDGCSGDQFDRPNFEPAMGEERLVAGYRRLLAAVYAPEAYYARCEQLLAACPPPRGPLRPGSAAALARAVWRIGVLGARRHEFWRLVAGAARRRPADVGRAVALAVLGEHLVRYTAEEVLPRLDGRLAELRAARLEGGRRGAAAGIESLPGAPGVSPSRRTGRTAS